MRHRKGEAAAVGASHSAEKGQGPGAEEVDEHTWDV